MTVKRIVSNIAASEVEDVQRFYADLFGLNVVMNHGWIVTLASDETARTQLSIATEGGSGTAVPDLSIEVEDVDAVYQRARTLGHAIEYELTDEPWGVRRFYLFDPTGKLLNILSHPA
ncbi:MULTISPECIES: VOC family protein [Roseovarius]|uniref:VOC family protein n=1 Tax=Roseovarius TaxID=74030 RepID=UPI001C95F12F|nr:VOC family protein [Roseovarius atlanticus]MBY5986644.1 VOC family protein [Roseovarius atlanticus]MBY6125284.1 VOC family protein [Roseovarius atlanticus]MBY6150255.1 VOC family protein [Roseovarius atlanticus]